VITPSIYLGIRLNETTLENATMYVNSTLEEARRLSVKHNKPVVPISWMMTNNYWQIASPADREYITRQELDLQIAMPFRYGAQAVLLWGALREDDSGHGIDRAVDYHMTELADAMAEVCSEFDCCGTTECVFGAPTTTTTTVAPVVGAVTRAYSFGAEGSGTETLQNRTATELSEASALVSQRILSADLPCRVLAVSVEEKDGTLTLGVEVEHEAEAQVGEYDAGYAVGRAVRALLDEALA